MNEILLAGIIIIGAPDQTARISVRKIILWSGLVRSSVPMMTAQTKYWLKSTLYIISPWKTQQECILKMYHPCFVILLAMSSKFCQMASLLMSFKNGKQIPPKNTVIYCSGWCYMHLPSLETMLRIMMFSIGHEITSWRWCPPSITSRQLAMFYVLLIHFLLFCKWLLLTGMSLETMSTLYRRTWIWFNTC